MSLDDAGIARVARGMVARTLPKAEWTHEAHFATALWLLRHRPDLQLPVALPWLIRAYNASLGGINDDTQGYHETITQASLRPAQAMLRATGDAPLPAILRELMASPLGKPDWLFVHWTRDRLLSPKARRVWLAPDLAPLPWPPLA